MGVAAGLEGLGGCLLCGSRFLAVVVCFARCSGCASHMYVPQSADAEPRVAQFWARAELPSGVTLRGAACAGSLSG